MRILFIGDVVGRPGRRALRRLLPEIQDTHSPELTVVNVEHAAGGFGVTAQIVDEFLASGEIDLLTSGNHIWDKPEALIIVDEEICQRDWPGIHMILTVHDEIVLEVPYEYHSLELMKQVVECMQRDSQILKMPIPFPIDVAVSNSSWSEETKITPSLLE